MGNAPTTLSIAELSRVAQKLEGPRVQAPPPARENASIREAARQLLSELESALFPRQHPWAGGDGASAPGRIELLGLIAWQTTHLVHRSTEEVCPLTSDIQADCERLDQAMATALALIDVLPDIQQMLVEDAESAFQGDPAARSRQEVVFTYPGFYAVMVYRLAHALHASDAALLARVLSEIARSTTGIEIHPGAEIGRRFFIDHGTGVVIGETAVIGSGVTLYQGVTLGAVNFPRDASGAIIRGQKRHPTIEDDVVIYSGATILGGSTVIGRGTVIGGNVWLTESVPAGSRVTAEPKIELRQTAHRT